MGHLIPFMQIVFWLLLSLVVILVSGFIAMMYWSQIRMQGKIPYFPGYLMI